MVRLCCPVTLCLCGEKGTMKEPVVISWSGGKDSAMALYEVQRSGAYDVLALLTTVTADYDRVSMHGVRRELVQRQAQSLGVSLEPIWISKNASNEEYESKLLQALRRYQDRGVRRAVFGDLFLEDIRAYRENVLGRIGMSGIYPIWQRDTTQMAQDFIALGFRAIVICVDSRVLPASFAGKVVDQELLRSLPPGVDPCGENGEFHTFVYAGPILSEEVRFTAGEVVLRDSFYFCELSSEFTL